MEARNWMRFATLGSLAMLAVFSAAQQTPPPPPEEEPQDADQAVEEPEPRTLWNWISLGYTGWEPRGDKFRIRPYATPPEGITLKDLHFFTPGGDKMPFARLRFRGMLDQDSVGDGLAIFNRGATVVEVERKESQFFARSLTPTEESRDREASIMVSHAITPNIGAFVKYRDDSRKHAFEAPRGAERTRSRTISGGVAGKVLGGHATVTVADHRFYDSTGTQPTTLQRRFDANYVADVGPTFNIEGSAGVTKIEQTGLPSSHIRNYALAGSWDFADSTALHFHLGRQDRDLNTVQNAYVKSYFTTSARLVHRWNRWSAQLGFRHNEAERFRADQSFVDVPKWNVWDARVFGRINDNIRLTAKGSWEEKKGDAVMLTADPRSMLWNDKASAELKLDGGNEMFNGYASLSYRYRRNAHRGIEVRWHNFAVGGSYVFSPEVLGYLEFARDGYKVTGGTETGIALEDFFAESLSLAAGVDWTVSANDSLSVAANFYETNNERGFRLTGQYRRQISPNQAISVFVAPWRLDDRQFGRSDYRTTLFGVDYTLKF